MGRIFWQVVGVLLVVGFIGAYFWWIVRHGRRGGRRGVGHPADASSPHGPRPPSFAARNAEIAARADRQHRWVLAEPATVR